MTNPQRIQSTPPVQCVRSARTLSASLVLLLLLPGCTTPLGDGQETEGIDCEMEPTTEGCFEPVVTEDDCTPTQVFTGESCRIMLRPEKLDFGTSEATLQIGTEMQQLTPSFLGDAPRKWAVNPQLPDGIEIDLESGVISGTPNYEEPSRHYTIIASNAAGITSFRIQITVLPIPVISVQLQSPEMNCTCLLYTSPSPRDVEESRMPSSA